MVAIVLSAYCTKDDSARTPDPDKIDPTTIMEFKDSTLLLKRIMQFGIDYSGNYVDSNIINLYYDTIHKKLISIRNIQHRPILLFFK